MKIIEAMKEIKRLEEKVQDLQSKIQTYCVDRDIETPVYPDQAGQIKEWLQSSHDSLKEAERLRLAIQKTNLETEVEIQMGEKRIKKSIAAWIIRRRLYAPKEQAVWSHLGDKGLTDGRYQTSANEVKEFHVRRYYSPKEKDQKIEEYRQEPMLIDRTLEVVNAVTDVKE